MPRLGLNVVFVFGTEEPTLRKGPGLHRSTRLPGQGGLIYVAGHRTTYQAPFAHVERLRRGDLATVETPYGAKSFDDVEAGKTRFHPFMTRQSSVAAGTAAVTATAVVDGHEVSTVLSVPYDARTCR